MTQLAIPAQFRTPALCEATGLTYRQLQYWHQVGAITPTTPGTGSGDWHQWSEDDIARVHRIARVVRLFESMGFTGAKGMSTSLIARLWATPLDECITIGDYHTRLVVAP